MHENLCNIAWAHVSEAAHEPQGISSTFELSENVKKDAVQYVGSTAIVDVNGVIGRKFSSFLNSSGVTSVDVLDNIMRHLANDEFTKSIVLNMDTPGGAVTGTPETADTIAEVGAEKPVVAFADGLMASAGYWLAASADSIIASKSADVGSIGVYLAFLDVSRKLDSEGVTLELFKRGKFKGMGVPGSSLTEEQRELLQSGVDKIYDEFTSFVRSNRRVDSSAFEGQTFTGQDAIDAGLVDRIGTISDAIAEAKGSE
jgi:signal peptide peptidase SppA